MLGWLLKLSAANNTLKKLTCTVLASFFGKLLAESRRTKVIYSISIIWTLGFHPGREEQPQTRYSEENARRICKTDSQMLGVSFK